MGRPRHFGSFCYFSEAFVFCPSPANLTYRSRSVGAENGSRRSRANATSNVRPLPRPHMTRLLSRARGRGVRQRRSTFVRKIGASALRRLFLRCPDSMCCKQAPCIARFAIAHERDCAHCAQAIAPPRETMPPGPAASFSYAENVPHAHGKSGAPPARKWGSDGDAFNLSLIHI